MERRDKLDLGRYLKVLRAKEGLTQRQLAEKLGYTREYLADIERGAKYGSFEFWANLNIVFNVSENDFIEIIKERTYLIYEKKNARKGARA